MRKKSRRRSAPGLRAEYALDYRKARTNRFSSRLRGDVRTVALDPDVASQFPTSKSVNDALRQYVRAKKPV
jgi:hypothetical protein